MKNRDGYEVEVAPIEKVDFYEDGGCAITRGEPGWGTFRISAEELNGFKPQVGDIAVVYTQGFSTIRGIVIDGRVIRYTTPAQAAAEYEQWKKNRRLEKLERYLSKGDELKERVKSLHPVLQARMNRFAEEGGVEFWIDSAEYEMAALEGANALIKAAQKEIPPTSNVAEFEYVEKKQVQWVEDWWDINSDKHDPPYDYKKQMEMVPDFGDGHSGNTAGAAKQMAVMILSGNGHKL